MNAAGATAQATGEIKLFDLFLLCSDQFRLFSWLREQGVLIDLASVKCKKRGEANFRITRDPNGTTYPTDREFWKCCTPKCNTKVSIRSDSWFAQSKLSIRKTLLLTYLWIYRAAPAFIMRELEIGSRSTIVDWQNFAREVCVSVLERESEPIGGPGTIVEIDESKFGKRKFNKGRRVDGSLIFGGIERDNPQRCFMVRVADRTADTLIPLIREYIRPGTKILSDCWRPYDRLQSEGFTHETVNHSIEFVSETGAHTQTIESTWRAVKCTLPGSGGRADMLDSYLAEFIFRRRYLEGQPDQFLAFLKKVLVVYPAKQLP
ncbi:uncharacterized protein [Diadema setosum]|uniref:uncharacterized protein n=1 Tax=Diadema setosum TaxID=31175 RepID=UPI003B3BD590